MLWPKFPAFFCKVIFCISAFCWCTFLSYFLLDNKCAFYYPSIIYKLDTYLFICCWWGGTFRHILIVRSRDMKIIYQFVLLCISSGSYYMEATWRVYSFFVFLCRLLSWLMIHPLLLVTTCLTCDQLAPAVVTIIPL